MTGEQSPLWRWQRPNAEQTPVHVEPIDFSAIGGWREDDHSAALKCYLASAANPEWAVSSPAPDKVQLLLRDSERARSFFEQEFRAFRVMAEPGLLTAYFEPVLKGSWRRSKIYAVPVYRRPDDLNALPSGHELLAAGLTAGRELSGRFEPYYTRAEIEAGALEGARLEILYLADPIEAFIMHVQGSCKIELEDGSVVRIGFDGKNGHPYTSISRCLVEWGCLTREEADLDGTVAWLRAQPEPQHLLNENKSYIFFKELEAQEAGPMGSMGVTLHGGRSLAVDPWCHGLGTPIWVAAPDLSFDGQPLARLLVAQDTGSAIVGPQRGDIFAGMGAEAGCIAGRIRHRCEFIILRPKR